MLGWIPQVTMYNEVSQYDRSDLPRTIASQTICTGVPLANFAWDQS